MIPSRGLQPVRRAQLAASASLLVRAGTARQFSSAHRRATLSTASSLSRRIQRRRLDACTVRYASWYAPWTWGRSSTPAPETEASPIETKADSEPLAAQQNLSDPAVAASTPELTATTSAQEASGQTVSAATDASRGSVEEYLDNALEFKWVDDAAATVTKYGDLKAMGLDYGWGPTAMVEWMMEHLYLGAGLGWGASIIALTLIIRTTMFKLQMNSSDAMARLAAITPVMRKLNAEMTAAKAGGKMDEMQVVRRKMTRVYKVIGANPAKSFLPLGFQAVIGFGAFRCLRGMSNLPVPDMTQAGFLWFQDLTVSDPYMIIPVVAGGIMYVSMKMGGEAGPQSDQSMGTEGMRTIVKVGIPVMMTIVGMFQPAAVQLYLLCTSTTSSIAAYLLRNASFRQRFNLAPLPTKEAQEFWNQVADGKYTVEEALRMTAEKGKLLEAGPVANKAPTLKYEAPRLRLKGELPAHIRPPAPKEKEVYDDRDEDFDNPPERIMDRLDWFGRNYKPSFVWKRAKKWMRTAFRSGDVQAQLARRKKEEAKKKAEEYELRRRARLRGQ
ncbi:uncharacterized protein EI97DRAFT_107490 [Westerdykella ornata]|uniref:Membrane insertase YidC/Oxa/ALB C-terminal domain-containing protein n=1 Tax=Westerdykella ornata TaxID=318751 RepID=A0A6A6JV70_WESOR|nr:uncharacterized protein EI97DRAFT_107490 [Westerdykella ornata]KAF2279993.1 hypothetical protein EI97DRAFT_107490 [Westerdykella ornata]